MEVSNNSNESWNFTTSSLIRKASNSASIGITHVTQITLTSGSKTSSEKAITDLNGVSGGASAIIHTSTAFQQLEPTTEGNWYDGYDYIPYSQRNNESNVLLTETATSIPFLLHIYGFATLFIWLDLFIVFVSLTSKKRVVKRPATLGIMILFAIFSTNFAVLLTADPYGVRNILPSVLITVVLYFKYMSFIITFWLIQRILKNMSTMKQIASHNENNDDCNEYRKSQERKIRAFAPMCLIYFCIMITIAVVTSIKPELHILHLIPQAIYVTATIVLCFTFLYSALNISQYTKQTSRVLDETIIYSKMQSRLKENGRCADVSMDLYRVKRDKLEFEGDWSPEDDDGLSMPKNCGSYIHGSDSSSNESLAFFNHVALSDPAKIEEIFENRQKGFQRDREEKSKKLHKTLNEKCKKNGIVKNGNKNVCLKQKYAILESTTDCGFSSDNDDGSMLESHFNGNNIDHKNTFPVKLQMRKMTSLLQGTKGTVTKSKRGTKSLDSKPVSHNHSTVFYNNAFNCDNQEITTVNIEQSAEFKESTLQDKSFNNKDNTFKEERLCGSNVGNSLSNPALKGTSDAPSITIDNKTTSIKSIRKSNATTPAASVASTKNLNAQQHYTEIPRVELLTKPSNAVPFTLPPRELLPNDRFEDNGYLADIENALMEESNDIDEQGYDQGEEIGHQSSDKIASQKSPILPRRCYNYLGLQRVRKGRCVKKIMQTTYCTTVFAFLLSVLELYEMFSVKGVLTGLDSSGEYTWLLFESFLRFSEIGFASTVMRSVQIWGRPRRIVSKKPAVDYSDIHYSPDEDSDSPNVQSMC